MPNYKITNKQTKQTRIIDQLAYENMLSTGAIDRYNVDVLKAEKPKPEKVEKPAAEPQAEPEKVEESKTE